MSVVVLASLIYKLRYSLPDADKHWSFQGIKV